MVNDGHVFAGCSVAKRLALFLAIFVIAVAWAAASAMAEEPLGAVESTAASVRTAAVDLQEWLNSEEALSRLAQHNVYLDENGKIRACFGACGTSGELTPANAGWVYIVRHGRGEVVHTAGIGALGEVSLEGLPPGVYSVVVGNDASLAAFSIRIRDTRDPDAAEGSRLMATSRLEVSLIAQQNLRVLDRLMATYWPSAGIVPSRLPLYSYPREPSTLVQPPSGSLPDPNTTQLDVGELPLPGDVAAQQSPDDGPWYGRRTFQLAADGELGGMVRGFGFDGELEAVEGRVFFLQGGRVIGATRSDRNGVFTVAGLQPGICDVVVVAPPRQLQRDPDRRPIPGDLRSTTGWFGALSVALVPAADEAGNQSAARPIRFAALRSAAPQPAPGLLISAMPLGDLMAGGAGGTAGGLGAVAAPLAAGGVAGGSGGLPGLLGAGAGAAGGLLGDSDDPPPPSLK